MDNREKRFVNVSQKIWSLVNEIDLLSHENIERLLSPKQLVVWSYLKKLSRHHHEKSRRQQMSLDQPFHKHSKSFYD